MTRQPSFKVVLCLFVSAVCVLEALPAEGLESYVLGYYGSRRKETLPAEKIDFKTITHICHAFVVPNKDGSLDYRNDFLYPELIETAHKAGRKVLVSLGGGGGGRAVEAFPPVAANPPLRRKFISNLIDFCLTHGYDGIDFDWEYPKNLEERDNHALLVSELREAVDKLDTPLLITMAIGARIGSEKTFDHVILKEKLDWFNVMTYDFHGPWMNRAGHNSPIYGVSLRPSGAAEGCYTAISFLRDSMGIPAEKLLLGLPFYGFVLEASHIRGPSDGGRYINYNEVILKWAEGDWTYKWDEVSMVPWMIHDSHDQIITFDNPRSISLKCNFARVNGLRGVMIWALGQDVMNDRSLLLEVVGREKWEFDPD